MPRRGDPAGGELLFGEVGISRFLLPRLAANDAAGKADAFRDHDIEALATLVGPDGTHSVIRRGKRTLFEG
jgi:hypothetical protein